MVSVPETAVPATPLQAADGVRRIEPSRRRLRLDLPEIWAYRELLAFLVWRDVKVRYKQTLLGVLWAVLQPFLAMIVFTIIFGHLIGVKSQYGVPYPIFVFAGLLPWQYFSGSLTLSSTSLLSNASLVTKVYFPRLIIPLTSIAVPVVDFVFGFLVLLGLFAWYGVWPSWRIVALPVFLLMALLAAFGTGLWLSAANVRYRDVPYTLPFITQLWFYATPVVYSAALVPPGWRWLLALNPMTGVVDGFRWALFGNGPADWGLYAVSAGVGLALCATGLLFFRRIERRFADII